MMFGKHKIIHLQKLRTDLWHVLAVLNVPGITGGIVIATTSGRVMLSFRLFAVEECTGNMVFKASTSPCLPTCADPNAPANCAQAAAPGCGCADDSMVVTEGECVSAATCPCIDPITSKEYSASEQFDMSLYLSWFPL